MRKRHYQLNRFIIICFPVVVLWIVDVPLGVARSGITGRNVPPLSISLTSEYNENYGYFAPGRTMSFTSVVNDGLLGPPYIVTSGSVAFSLEEIPGTPNTLSLSTTLAPINGCGQATVELTASQTGAATLKATWTDPIDPVRQTTRSMRVDAYTQPCQDSGQVDPAIWWGRFINNCELKYFTNTQFSDDVDDGIEKWKESHWTKVWILDLFEGNWNVYFEDVINPNVSWMANTDSIGNNVRSISFNVPNLNPCPTGTDPATRQKYPPRSARHHMLELTAHEIGHAMGLAHLEAVGHTGALMWPAISNYFFCGTESVRPDENAGLAAAPLSYLQCP